MKQVSIIGVGTWVPDETRDNSAWPESFSVRAKEGDRTFNDIPSTSEEKVSSILSKYREEERDPFLGSELRHVSDPKETAVGTSVSAARAALGQAGVDPGSVELVLSNAVVPDRMGPVTACAVAHGVGADNARAIDMDVACASAVCQLEMATAYIRSGMAKVVLCTQSHLMLRTIPMAHPASPGLGDGASAFVVSESSRGLVVRSVFSRTYGQYADAVIWRRGRGAEEEVPWHQEGGPFHLGTKQPEFVKALMAGTIAYGAEAIRRAALMAEVDPFEISVIASVQPRGYLPGAIAEMVGLPPSAAVTTYKQVAHLGACGPVFNLAAAERARSTLRRKVVALYGQGAGFTIAAAILDSF